jgi:hypothetical protein
MPYVFIVGLGAALATLLESVLALVTAKDHGQSLQAFLHNSRGAQTPVGWMVSLDWQQWLSHFQGTVSPVAAPSTSSTPPYVLADWQILQTVLCHPYKLLLCISVVAVACLGLAWRVDLNEFSMNLFYRNRLVRCYLGASRKSRRPNPFTGFDPDDDLYVGDLRAANCYSGPFPIINTTLNLVKGQNLAWQQRKAESFVVTPFRCGFDTWLERLDLDTESEKMAPSGIQKYAFRPAGNYAYRHGLRVGTAVSISGAAASPNMGYHSSPSLAFLMTFFNVRLGFWAGNPRNNSTWTRPGPRFSLFQLLTELFGLTDDEASYVYLSDGGHFENLGLYELIKRRCRYIVVCDADCDGSYAFGDLGNAIQKCREDVGVEITMATTNLTPQKAPGASGDAGAGGANGASPAANVSKWHWAIGEIQYSLVDPNAEDGILVYLKASLTGDEPVDVLNYHRQHPDFPHETTADQWFTESQFESYRRLGQHVVEELFAKTPDPIKKGSTGNIFESLKTDWPTQLKRPCTCRVP